VGGAIRPGGTLPPWRLTGATACWTDPARRRQPAASGVTKIYPMGEVEVRALRGVDADLYRGELMA
jgi:hypothetical protein